MAHFEDRGRELPGLVLGRGPARSRRRRPSPRPRPVRFRRAQASAWRPRPWSIRAGRGATGFNPAPGAVPGQDQNVKTLPFKNFQISDIGSNFDYTFRAGLFAGDYSGNTSGPIVNGDSKDGHGDHGDGHAAAFWTDARNGRGSGDPTSTEPGSSTLRAVRRLLRRLRAARRRSRARQGRGHDEGRAGLPRGSLPGRHASRQQALGNRSLPAREGPPPGGPSLSRPDAPRGGSYLTA